MHTVAPTLGQTRLCHVGAAEGAKMSAGGPRRPGSKGTFLFGVRADRARSVVAKIRAVATIGA
jgi:hypothetical protein